ncbi:putative Acid phosphatase [Helianthus annuus]|nr:putative Acid phosphatase [Helianthus annuus]
MIKIDNTLSTKVKQPIQTTHNNSFHNYTSKHHENNNRMFIIKSLLQMETILAPRSLSSLFNLKSTLQQQNPTRSSNTLTLPNPKPLCCNLKKDSFFQSFSAIPTNPTWFSHGLAALAISLALNFTPVGSAVASEFDVLNDGPPKESYVVDDAGVLSRVTRSDLKNLLSDLEYRKKIRINFVTVRKLTSKADAFEYADQVLERWYPTLEEGNNKGIVVLVTSQKEGAVTGGPAFIQAVGDTVLDSVVSQNLPVLAVDEKYNEALYSSAKRLAAAIDGLPDPGGPQPKDAKRESNFKTKEETAEKRDQFTVVVGGLKYVISFGFMIRVLSYNYFVDVIISTRTQMS